jgi:hypothetical protein
VNTERLADALNAAAGANLDAEQADAVREALELVRDGAELLRPGDLFGPQQAAAYCSVNRTTVSRWKREGYMPAPFADLGGSGTWTVHTRDVLDTFNEMRAAEIGDGNRRTSAATPAESAA